MGLEAHPVIEVRLDLEDMHALTFFLGGGSCKTQKNQKNLWLEQSSSPLIQYPFLCSTTCMSSFPRAVLKYLVRDKGLEQLGSRTK